MSERAPGMVRNLDYYPKFAVTFDKNGHPRFYTVDKDGKKTRRLTEDEYLTAWGYEAERQPIPAVWRRDDEEIQVGVIRKQDEVDGVKYYEVESWLNGGERWHDVPEDQIEWLPNPEKPETPEAPPAVTETDRELSDEIKELRNSMQEMEQRLSALEKRNQDLEAEKAGLKQRIDDLEREKAELYSALQSADVEIPDTITPPPRSWRERLEPWREKFSQWRDRAYTLPNRLWLSRTRIYNEDGRLVEEHREGTAVPYAIAGALVGGFAVWLAMKNGDNGGLFDNGFDDWIDKRELDLGVDIDDDGDIGGVEIVEGDNGPATPGDTGGLGGAEGRGDHIGSFEVLGGNGRSFVELPQVLDVGGSEGHWYIYDTRTDARIVEMGVNVEDIQDRQGNLSVEARDILEPDYDLTQKKKVYLDASGKRRWHYYTDVGV